MNILSSLTDFFVAFNVPIDKTILKSYARRFSGSEPVAFADAIKTLIKEERQLFKNQNLFALIERYYNRALVTRSKQIAAPIVPVCCEYNPRALAETVRQMLISDDHKHLSKKDYQKKWNKIYSQVVENIDG